MGAGTGFETKRLHTRRVRPVQPPPLGPPPRAVGRRLPGHHPRGAGGGYALPGGRTAVAGVARLAGRSRPGPRARGGPFHFNWPGPGWPLAARGQRRRGLRLAPGAGLGAPARGRELREHLGRLPGGARRPCALGPRQQDGPPRSRGGWRPSRSRAPPSAMALLDEATARAGRGLEGDRYFEGEAPSRTGFKRPRSHPDRGERLEAITALLRPHATAEDARRNVVTRGRPHALVGGDSRSVTSNAPAAGCASPVPTSSA